MIIIFFFNVPGPLLAVVTVESASDVLRIEGATRETRKRQGKTAVTDSKDRNGAQIDRL